MLAFCYGLTLLTLGDLGFDLASGVFALLLSLNAYLSYSIIKSKPKLFAQAEAEPLTYFIYRVCKSFNFEQIEQSRHKFCFDCMRIHHNKEDDKIAHCPSKSCNGCIRHFQKHSGLYGVCIGQHNVGLYYLNCILTFVLSIFWLRQSIWSMKPFFTTDYSFTIVFWMSATFALWERSRQALWFSCSDLKFASCSFKRYWSFHFVSREAYHFTSCGQLGKNLWPQTTILTATKLITCLQLVRIDWLIIMSYLAAHLKKTMEQMEQMEKVKKMKNKKIRKLMKKTQTLEMIMKMYLLEKYLIKETKRSWK